MLQKVWQLINLENVYNNTNPRFIYIERINYELLASSTMYYFSSLGSHR